MSVVKNRCGPHGTIKSTVSQEWFIQEWYIYWADFLDAGANSGKLKVTLIVVGLTLSNISMVF